MSGAPGTVAAIGLIHPETHFTDEKAGALRRTTYRRLRRHWQFVNELSLFDVHHLVSYGVHVYAADQPPSFVQATSLYHPSTVEASRKHDGSGPEPGLKTADGKWDVSAHLARIQHVDASVLETWHAILEDDDVPVEHTRMVYTVNRATASVLAKLASAPRIGDLDLKFSAGWHEKNDRTKGFFEAEWGVPESWDQVILQGPHIHVANPAYKTPNETMLHNQDWTAVDLEALAPDAVPATSYKPAGDPARYDAEYDRGAYVGARHTYRLAWRMMAANTGERTLVPTLIPPGAAHIHGMSSLGGEVSSLDLAMCLGAATSLLADLGVRAVPKAVITATTVARLPRVAVDRLAQLVAERAGRLVAVTDAYGTFWRDLTNSEWSPLIPLRNALDRRKALIEIDALLSVALGLTADELCTVYRTQFPVLYAYDRNVYLYDANGRLVPTSVRQAWKRAGEPAERTALEDYERTGVHPGSGVAYLYELPFAYLDREAGFRAAYARFAHLADHSVGM